MQIGNDKNYGVDFRGGSTAIQNQATNGASWNPYGGIGEQEDSFINDKPEINYLWYILGIFIMLVVFKFATEHEKANMDTHLLGIGMWNMVAVGLLASFFILIEKVAFNKFYVKGLTEMVNAI
jgi:hypothetical protein